MTDTIYAGTVSEYRERRDLLMVADEDALDIMLMKYGISKSRFQFTVCWVMKQPEGRDPLYCARSLDPEDGVYEVLEL